MIATLCYDVEHRGGDTLGITAMSGVDVMMSSQVADELDTYDTEEEVGSAISAILSRYMAMGFVFDERDLEDIGC